MFKPEYIMDNVAAFGLDATLKIITDKFVRMGKKRAIADLMALELIRATIWCPAHP